MVAPIPFSQGTIIQKNLLLRCGGGPNKLFLFSGRALAEKSPALGRAFFFVFLRGGLDDNAFVSELLVDLLGTRIAHAQLGLQVRNRRRLIAAIHIVAH